MELSQFKDKIDLLPVDQKREILQLLESMRRQRIERMPRRVFCLLSI